jgi:AraC-like DNA-binding protein
MKLQLIDIVNIVALFQLLVFIFFLTRRKSNRDSNFWEQPNRLLSMFLFIQVFVIFSYECLHLQQDVIHVSPHLFYLGTPFFYLAAPVFYFYVRSVAFSDFRFRVIDILHAAPFLAVVIIFASRFYFLSSHAKIILLTQGEVFSPQFWIAFNLMFFIQFFVYFLIDIRILKYYRVEIKQQYSSVQNINLSWLTFILYGFILAWLSSVAAFISRNYILFMFDEIQLFNCLAFFCFFNYIFYKGLSQPEIFSGIVEKPRYGTSRLTPAEGEVYFLKLQSYMTHMRPYMNPTLTLKDLAAQLSISQRYLSQVINESAHQNFYDFVNRYRIEEAKKLLSDESVKKNIMETLFEVGFNSKSSFNTAFKKVTGVTPTHFKKHHSASPEK